jgi:hypothetical protein
MWYPPPRQKVLKVFERLGLGLYFGWWLVIFAGVERLAGRRVVDFEGRVCQVKGLRSGQ